MRMLSREKANRDKQKVEKIGSWSQMKARYKTIKASSSQGLTTTEEFGPAWGCSLDPGAIMKFMMNLVPKNSIVLMIVMLMMIQPCFTNGN